MTDEELTKYFEQRIKESLHKELTESGKQGKLEEFFEDMKKKGMKEEKIHSLVNQMIEILNKQQ